MITETHFISWCVCVCVYEERERVCVTEEKRSIYVHIESVCVCVRVRAWARARMVMEGPLPRSARPHLGPSFPPQASHDARLAKVDGLEDRLVGSGVGMGVGGCFRAGAWISA